MSDAKRKGSGAVYIMCAFGVFVVAMVVIHLYLKHQHKKRLQGLRESLDVGLRETTM